MIAELLTTAPLFAQFSTVPFVSFAAATPAAIMPLARMSPPFALPRTVPLFSAVTPATLAVPLTAARFRLLEIVPLFLAAIPAV